MQKVHRYAYIAKFLNHVLLSRWHVFLYCAMLSLFVAGLNMLFGGLFLPTFIILLIPSAILARLTIRLNNEFVYLRGLHTVMMSVRDVSSYHNKNYVNNRKEIASEFQEAFISALESAHAREFKRVNMRTHGWVYQHILQNTRVSDRYVVHAKHHQDGAVPTDVLVLVSPATLETETQKIEELAFRVREKYKISMVAK